MTAQVAILTSSCAVLAADSAVTISGRAGQKVYTGVEKIYPLSDDEPTAALVYGLGTLLDVPWGTLLSEYRHRFGSTAYTSIEHQAENLLGFLNDRLQQTIQAAGQDMRRARINGLIAAALQEAQNRFMEASMQSDADSLTPENVLNGVATYLREIVDVERESWKSSERLPDLTAAAERELHQSNRAFIDAIRKAALSELPLDAATSRAIGDVALLALTRKTPPGGGTPNQGGLVLVGFPEGDFWPKYAEFTFDGVGLPGLRYWPTSIGGCDGPHSALVHAFAQTDGVVTIMEGVHPDLRSMFRGRLESAGFDPSKVDEALRDADERWSEQRTMPILETLDVMPPPDLCEVAESLVSITALWQRMRGALETVGGTISVAVLAPGGPLRWAKRPNLSSP